MLDFFSMKSRSTWLVLIAVAAFAVTVVAAGKADRERCAGAVAATRISETETIGDALARLAPGGRWSVETHAGATRRVSYIAGAETYGWVCSPPSVPLVEPETPNARALMPWSPAP